jgi:hypothetical protein
MTANLNKRCLLQELREAYVVFEMSLKLKTCKRYNVEKKPTDWKKCYIVFGLDWIFNVPVLQMA